MGAFDVLIWIILAPTLISGWLSYIIVKIKYISCKMILQFIFLLFIMTTSFIEKYTWLSKVIKKFFKRRNRIFLNLESVFDTILFNPTVLGICKGH